MLFWMVWRHNIIIPSYPASHSPKQTQPRREERVEGKWHVQTGTIRVDGRRGLKGLRTSFVFQQKEHMWSTNQTHTYFLLLDSAKLIYNITPGHLTWQEVLYYNVNKMSAGRVSVVTATHLVGSRLWMHRKVDVLDVLVRDPGLTEMHEIHSESIRFTVAAAAEHHKGNPHTSVTSLEKEVFLKYSIFRDTCFC